MKSRFDVGRATSKSPNYVRHPYSLAVLCWCVLCLAGCQSGGKVSEGMAFAGAQTNKVAATKQQQEVSSKITKEQAITIAKELFNKEDRGALWMYQVCIESDPKNPEWVVFFKGGEWLYTKPLLHIVFVEKKTGKAVYVAGK
jgi:hypothetical protein